MAGKNRKHAALFSVVSLGIAIGAGTGCMSEEQKKIVSASLDIEDPSGSPSPSPSAAPSPGASASPTATACYSERFQQPDAEISRSIDILFVMDTSGSMDNKRAKVADGLSAFVSELPAQVDYRVGVILAHGSHSAWSGKLFSYAGNRVFDSHVLSTAAITAGLKNMVLHTPVDTGGEQGEEGTYSLMKGLTTNLDLIRAQGFLRTDAALAVVFVSDENDICGPSSQGPIPGMTAAEWELRNRDCAGGIASGTVISKVREIQGDRPYLFGAVVHKAINYSDAGGNDSYGYGYMDIIQAAQGVSTEIADGSYTEGLSQMGQLASVKLNLVLDYTLSHGNVDPSSLACEVDGNSQAFTFDALQNDVHLLQGGHARSQVEISYCEKAPTPVPSITPSPSPSPTVTPSPSPSPSPTPCIPGQEGCGIMPT